MRIGKKYHAAALCALAVAACAQSMATAAQARRSALPITFGPVPPSLDGWAARASELAPVWYSRIRKRFGEGGRPPPIAVVLRPDGTFVAQTARNRIALSIPYLEHNTDDIGVLAHEMTHVVQAYPNPSPTWVTEGMADYVRYYGIEPRSSRSGFDLSKDSFTRGYQPAAFLLRAVERQAGCGFVERLNAAMRRGDDIVEVWREATGTTPEESWRSLTASPDAARRVGRPDPSPCFR